MSADVIHLPVSAAALRRFRRIKYPAIFEPPPAPVKVKKKRRKKGVRPPTPSYGENILVIDSDGHRYPPTAHIEMVAALVFAELLKRSDIEVRGTPCGLGLWRQRRPMSDRMIKTAIRETKTIIFCKHGIRQKGPPVWLASAVRFAVVDRPKKEVPLQK